MAYDVFISYSRKDSIIAEEISSALSDAGISFFIDKEGIDGGQNFPQVLAQAVDDSTIFLFLASKNSYNSKFTRSEVTYSFNHKESGAIIPYIIDDSETMPPDLELMLGNFNWRHKSSCPIRPALIEDIRKAIANPDKGTIGGRTNVSSRKNKVFFWTIICVVSLLLVVAALFAISSTRNHRINQEALSASSQYEQLIAQADSLVNCAEAIKESENSIEKTSEQISYLKQAYSVLDSADAVRHSFDNSQFKGLFVKDIDNNQSSIKARLDSIHNVWASYAFDSYNLYKVSHRDSERENVLTCIEYALSIKSNKELESLKEVLNQ